MRGRRARNRRRAWRLLRAPAVDNRKLDKGVGVRLHPDAAFSPVMCSGAAVTRTAMLVASRT